MKSTETYWRAVLLVRNEAISGASHGRFAGPVVAIAVAASPADLVETQQASKVEAAPPSTA
jgi:hypothetical protein